MGGSCEEDCPGWVGGIGTAGDLGGLEGCTGPGWTGLVKGVRGFAALRAVLVFLPLGGGKTALLLGTFSVPLALGWVMEEALTGGSFSAFFWSAILTGTGDCWSGVREG